MKAPSRLLTPAEVDDLGDDLLRAKDDLNKAISGRRFDQARIRNLTADLKKAQDKARLLTAEVKKVRQECAAWEQQCKTLRKNLRGPNKGKKP